jgi:hypothetical protein
MELIGFGAMDVTKPCELIRFGVMGAKKNEVSKSFGSSSKHAEIEADSFGIVVCRFVGTVPDILGLLWPKFRPKSGSNSKISGRILKTCRGPF